MSPEGTDFLYPFIEGDERDAATLLADLARSAAGEGARRAAVSATTTLAACDEQLDDVAGAMAERFGAGGRAVHLRQRRELHRRGHGSRRCSRARRSGVPLAARCLADDEAVLTALGNDVGFELVFSRQIIAHAGTGRHGVRHLDQRRLENVLARVRGGEAAWPA